LENPEVQELGEVGTKEVLLFLNFALFENIFL
jgi:hypothetical protein